MVQKLSKWFSTKSSMFTLITFELWPNQTSILSLVYLKGVGVYCVQNILHSPKQKQWNSFTRNMDAQKVLWYVTIKVNIRAFFTCLYIVNRSCNNSSHFVMMSIFTYVIGTFDLPVYNENSSHMMMKNKYYKPSLANLPSSFVLHKASIPVHFNTIYKWVL